MDERAARRYLRIVGSFLVLVPGMVALYIATQPMNYANPAYALWSYQFEIARSDAHSAGDCSGPCNARILIVGDSRAQAALVPQAVGDEVRSLALMSGTPVDVYFLLRDYLDHHDAPEWIVFSFAPFHLQRIDERMFWNNSVKFGAHGFEDFLTIVDRTQRHNEPMLHGAGRVRVISEWLLHRAMFPPYYMTELKEAGLTGRRDENLTVLSEIVAQRGHYLFGRAPASSGISEEAKLEGFEPSGVVDEYLRDGIALAQHSGSRVHLRAMPMNESSRRRVAPRFETEYRSYIESLGRSFPAMVAYGELEALPDSHFGDGGHVNSRGAKRASNDLRAFLDAQASMLAGVAPHSRPMRK